MNPLFWKRFQLTMTTKLLCDDYGDEMYAIKNNMDSIQVEATYGAHRKYY